MKSKSAFASIRQLCSQGLDSHILIPRLLNLLHEIIPSNSNVFFWLGQDGDICDLYDENSEAYALLPIYVNKFVNNREKSVFDGWQHSVRFLKTVDMDEIWKVDRKQFMQSAFYIEFLQKLNYCWGLHRPIRSKGCSRGILQLHRGPDETRFTKKQALQLDEIAQFIEYAFSSPGTVGHDKVAALYADSVTPDHSRPQPDQESKPHLEQSWYEKPVATAIVICNQQGEMQQVSPEAERLILLASGGIEVLKTSLQAKGSNHLDKLLPENLMFIIDQLDLIYRGQSAMTPAICIDNKWGRFYFHGQLLNDATPAEKNKLCALQIEHFLPSRLALLDKIQTAALSARQSELSLDICSNMPYAEIAKKMGISMNTLISHKRELFRKLDVSSRHDLKNRIMDM